MNTRKYNEVHILNIDNLKNAKAITLVALVITIIILIVLAGISTLVLLGENGLFSKANLAKKKWNDAEKNEMEQISLLDKILGNVDNSRDNSISESKLINEFTPSISDYGKYIYISANATSKDNNQIYGYIFLVNGNVIQMKTDSECIYKDIEDDKDYNIEVIAVDNNGNFKKSSKVVYHSNYKKIVARYMVVEVYDHLSNTCAALNELEIYDKNSNKLEYTLLNAFDSVTNLTPAYWNDTNYWYYSNLYDNEISHTSNAEGGQNCTLFLFQSQPNTSNWSRFLVDLGENKEISNIKMAIGNAEGRIPKSVSTYVVLDKKYMSGTGENSTYVKNIKNRNNEDLILTHTEIFNNLFYTPTWYNFVD